MVGVVSSLSTGGNLIFCGQFLKRSMSILYRHAGFVLKTKTLNVTVSLEQVDNYR